MEGSLLLRRGMSGVVRAYGAARQALKGLSATLVLLTSLAGVSVADETVTVAALGDSLTHGFGLPPAEAFPAQLEAWLRARGHDVAVLNAGVSGDTTAGGLARPDWTLSGEVDAAIVELGGNDPVSYTPLTLPTNRLVSRLVVSGPVKQPQSTSEPAHAHVHRPPI